MAGDEMKCPECGATAYAADDRCMSCGAELDSGELVMGPSPELATREGEVEPDEAELASLAEPPADLRPEPERGSWWSRLTANTAQMLGLVKLAMILFGVGGMAGVNVAIRRWNMSWPVLLGIAVWVLGVLGLRAAYSYLLSRLHGTGKEANEDEKDAGPKAVPIQSAEGRWAAALTLALMVAAKRGLHLAIQRTKGPRQGTGEEADAESEDAGRVRLVRDRPTRGESPERVTPKRPGPGAKAYALDDPRALREASRLTGSSAPLVAAFVLYLMVIVWGAMLEREVWQAVERLGEQPPAFWVALAAVIACAAVLGALVGRHAVGVADTTDTARDVGGCLAVAGVLAIQAAVVGLCSALGAPVGWALGMVASTVVSMGVLLAVHWRFKRRRKAADDDAGVGADEQPQPGEQAERPRLREIRFTNSTNREITLHVSWHNPGDGWQEWAWTFVPEETSFLLDKGERIRADRIRHWGEATDDTGTWHAGDKNTEIEVTSDEDPFFEFFYEGNAG